AIRLNIDRLLRLGILQRGSHIGGKMSFNFYDQELEIHFESRVADPWDSWLRLKYVIHDYWTGDPAKLMTRYASRRRIHRSVAGGGGSSVRGQIGASVCCICLSVAGTSGRGAAIGWPMRRNGKRSTTGFAPLAHALLAARRRPGGSPVSRQAAANAVDDVQ